jgi:ABC-type transport system involved in multi-copper enzyme maturation permease subunit
MTDLPTAIRTVRWMVRDTFRQSLASKLFWVMLGLTVLCSVFCLGTSVTDAPPPRHPDELPFYMPKGQGDPEIREAQGRVSLGFGLFSFPIAKSKEHSVRQLHIWLAGVLADTVGVLLALLWTAGFLPTFLEPQSVSVLLAKPVPRWSLLLGKYLGVVIFVALHAFLFVAGTWVGLGIGTGVWDGAYLLAVPMLVLNFAVFYSFSTFLAVVSRSTVVAVFGTLVFWVLCWAMNDTRHRLVGFAPPGNTAAASTLVEVGYWVLPKPLDMSGVFFDVMGAEAYSMPVQEFEAVKARGQFFPELSILASMLFAGAILAIATYEFRKTDY